MGYVDDGGEDDRRVSVDVNLVPFIDLMSVCIIFLLITAVWSQVSMIQIGSSIYGRKSEDVSPIKPPPRAEIPFRLDVKPDGYVVVVGQKQVVVPKVGGEYDEPRLVAELKMVKELYPDKVDAVISMVDDLEYGYLIKGMDALLTSGFPEISVATGGRQ
ncbi:MAG: biopolymer transporter ExbD [Bdellovibrionales bacterium]|nr:biopolymer transporter ExbD [Bdellovibrionales bacterium]